MWVISIQMLDNPHRVYVQTCETAEQAQHYMDALAHFTVTFGSPMHFCCVKNAGEIRWVSAERWKQERLRVAA